MRWCRLESERDTASVEAGTLRRQLAGLRAESERAAQVGFLLITFVVFVFVYIYLLVCRVS